MTDPIRSRKKMEAKMKSEGRLPPGQSLTKRLPILHYGAVPEFDPETWDLRIWGAVENPVSLSWKEFSQLPRVTLKMDVHCVTKWSKFDTTWEGVPVKWLIDNGIFKPLPEAKFVIQHAEMDYTSNVPLEIMLSENFLLATHYEGQPLTPEHGAPLRGIIGAIPDRSDLKTVYFWKGAKWLRGLEFSTEDRPGFWEQAGYHNEGDVWKEERSALR